MKFLPLVLRNLVRNRRRTILTVLSIGISVFMFGALMTLPAVVAHILRDRVSTLRLVCANKAGFAYQLPAAYGSTIRLLPHVDAMTPYLATLASYRDPGQLFPVLGIDPTQLKTVWPDWGAQPDAVAALEKSRLAGLASTQLMTRFKWRVGDQVTMHSIVPPADLAFNIAGTLDDKVPGDIVIIPLDRMDKLEGDRGRVTAFFIRLDRSESAQQVIRLIDSRFANSANETETQTELGVAQTQVQQLRLLFVGAETIAAIIVVVIGLVAANTAAMTIRERRHELAVMRSIGFTRGSVVRFLTAEGLLIGLISGAIGSAIAYAAVTVLLRMRVLNLGGVMRPVASVFVESVVLAAAIGLVSIAIPALATTRRDVASTLRAI